MNLARRPDARMAPLRVAATVLFLVTAIGCRAPNPLYEGPGDAPVEGDPGGADGRTPQEGAGGEPPPGDAAGFASDAEPPPPGRDATMVDGPAAVLETAPPLADGGSFADARPLDAPRAPVDAAPPQGDAPPADGPAPPADASLTTGLVGHYEFDEGGGEKTADLSGHANTMSLSCVAGCGNGPPSYVTNPRDGTKAVQLVYWQAGEVKASESLNQMQKAFTISLWLLRILDYHDERAVLGREGEARDGTPAFRLSYIDGHPTFTVGTTRVSDPRVLPFASGGQGTWTHFAMRYDGKALTLFRAGNPVAVASPAPPPPAASTTSFFLGTCSQRGTLTTYADSGYDGVRLYDRALSDAEVAKLAGL